MACAAISVSLLHDVPSYPVLPIADYDDSYYDLHPVTFGFRA